jgi:uncharacterized protein YdeI (YjbR/CyaY-like superfamily)
LLLMPATDDKPLLTFTNAAEFREWLQANHADHGGIWLRYFKKASGQPTIAHKEAVQEALCWGWIDGQARPHDEVSWLVKFTPRGARSIWSQVNVGLVEQLMAKGRMTPAGMAVVEAAKADGRWQNAYASSSTFEMPEDFMAALAKKPKALAIFESLNKANRYAIYHRLHSAKRPETRAKRMKDFLVMLQRGERVFKA